MKHGRFNIDLAIPSARIAIEADGRYWHALPKQIAADARKDAALTAAGWRVLRFGEDQINEDVASCVAVVLASLGVRP
jgi:very-short-patch-repair endonuclease